MGVEGGYQAVQKPPSGQKVTVGLGLVQHGSIFGYKERGSSFMREHFILMFLLTFRKSFPTYWCLNLFQARLKNYLYFGFK